MKKVLKRILLLVVVAVGLLTVVVQLRSPSHEGDWQAASAVLPHAEVAGERVTISDVRNFAYDPDGSVREARYEERSYDLSELETLWYGISHFADFGLAHSFLSFGFTDGRYLAISVETRLEKGQSYNPLLGLLRSYELIYVLADERDVIGVRTHLRGERVLLYRIEAPLERIRALLLVMLQTVNEIYDHPRFYNTLIDNCTTNILQHVERLSPWTIYTDYRVILPGFSDELAYEIGAISNDVPLAEARRRAQLDPAAARLDDPEFSRLMRGL